jgi:sarcosine oxidase subunit gamma
MATIIGRPDRIADVVTVMGDFIGVAPPTLPKVVRGRDADLVWAGPHQWLLVSERLDLVDRAIRELAGLAAVSDQSAARAVVRLGGPRIRDALAKGCLIDLHPRVFAPGDVALTPICHIGVHLWQVDDLPTYELAVVRSMAKSFWSWLSASAAEYGCEVHRPATQA